MSEGSAELRLCSKNPSSVTPPSAAATAASLDDAAYIEFMCTLRSPEVKSNDRALYLIKQFILNHKKKHKFVSVEEESQRATEEKRSETDQRCTARQLWAETATSINASDTKHEQTA